MNMQTKLDVLMFKIKHKTNGKWLQVSQCASGRCSCSMSFRFVDEAKATAMPKDMALRAIVRTPFGMKNLELVPMQQ